MEQCGQCRCEIGAVWEISDEDVIEPSEHYQTELNTIALWQLLSDPSKRRTIYLIMENWDHFGAKGLYAVAQTAF